MYGAQVLHAIETVVFDRDGAEGESIYVTGGRAVDGSTHPDLLAEISRMRDLGYLAGRERLSRRGRARTRRAV